MTETLIDSGEVRMGTFTDEYRNKYVVLARLRIETAYADGRMTVEHEPVPMAALRVSITGQTWIATKSGTIDKRYRDCMSAGQNMDDLLLVKNERARRVAALWDSWHLNDMMAACAHMDLPIDKSYETRKNIVCPITGYKYGSAWLYKPVPDDAVKELLDLFGQTEKARELA